ncbi:DUF2231 domain-containing protein [Nocardioides currus]|uniref:DUF2231 domain-containing protein n=1 Tax=Nocardioides currus TaxID=2133958 RepID=A0A2R7YV34_9ACTN|nr:DUF2231 domain-containing protein [Nocardioides currus]PUA80270.1 hypothetical protein C7S10_14095 [Nocardioides currus]
MEINGLPLHPLVVHAVVILGPLAGLVGLAYAFVPRWRWLLRWPLVVLAVIVAIASVVAVQAGESLLDSRPELEPIVEDHEEWGERLRLVSVLFVPVAAFAAWAMGGTSALTSGRGAATSRGVLGGVATGLLVIGSLALMVLVFLAGDSGAQAVWG